MRPAKCSGLIYGAKKQIVAPLLAPRLASVKWRHHRRPQVPESVDYSSTAKSDKACRNARRPRANRLSKASTLISMTSAASMFESSW